MDFAVILIKNIVLLIFSFISFLDIQFNHLANVEADLAVATNATFQIGSLFKSALIFLAGLSLVIGASLALIARFFYTKTDPKVEQVEEHLAHAHCGACGFAGCGQYAEAVVKDPNISPNLCTPAGPDAAAMIASITGKQLSAADPTVAFVFCGGDSKSAKKKFIQNGVKDCLSATFIAGGDKECPFGCLGYGSCVSACPFDAITMGENGLPIVDVKKCVSCGKCVKACPRKLIAIVPEKNTHYVICRSFDKGAVVKKYCSVGCIGCGLCVKVCPSEAITLEQNLARIDPKKCTSCGACAQKCPTKAIIKV
jgi:Na+-translocating ferredoxin:NAD+ oxidoreductase RNF subunit RnfB